LSFLTVQSDSKSLENLRVVPEMDNTYIDLTAWENLMLMGKLYGVDKKRRSG
jgi:ABC-type multidrug transport system ATPase subunit